MAKIALPFDPNTVKPRPPLTMVKEGGKYILDIEDSSFFASRKAGGEDKIGLTLSVVGSMSGNYIGARTRVMVVIPNMAVEDAPNEGLATHVRITMEQLVGLMKATGHPMIRELDFGSFKNKRIMGDLSYEEKRPNDSGGYYPERNELTGSYPISDWAGPTIGSQKQTEIPMIGSAPAASPPPTAAASPASTAPPSQQGFAAPAYGDDDLVG